MLVKATQLRSGGGKPDRLRTRVNLALLSVFLFFVLLWNLLLWYRYDQTIQESERRASNLALILTEHLQRSVDAVDAALVQLSLHSQRVGGPRPQPIPGYRYCGRPRPGPAGTHRSASSTRLGRSRHRR